MELSVFLFFLALMIPGFWLVLGFRRIVRQREFLDEQQRIEQERINSMSVRRRSSRASSAQDDAGSPVEDTSPAVASTEPALAHDEAASGDWSDAQAEDSWQDLNSSHIGTACESFRPRTPNSSERFRPSQVEDAFKKFRTD